MAYWEWSTGQPLGVNRARNLALRAIAKGAPPWVSLGAIAPDSVLVGEEFFSGEDDDAEPWAFGLTEGERSQVRLVSASQRPAQAERLRASHAVVNQPAWAVGLTHKERDMVQSISGDKVQYAAELRAYRASRTE